MLVHHRGASAGLSTGSRTPSPSSQLHRSTPCLTPSRSRGPSSRTVTQASPQDSPSWEAWSKFMASRKPAPTPTAAEQKSFNDIASSISQCAATYTPKFAAFVEPPPPAIVLQPLESVSLPAAEQLPKDLPAKLETVGVAALKGVLKPEGQLEYANIARTTTDVDAALSITGSILQTGTDRTAVVVMVASEAEQGPAGSSQLDRLVLHWGCSTAQGGPWAMPPPGWSATPSTCRDAGGASQCAFRRCSLGKESVYALVLQLPLRGVLKSGGLVFVLKGEVAKTDKWMKDSASTKDFFLDLAQFPINKL